MVLAQDVSSIEDKFIDLLQHIPGTKKDKQVHFLSRGIRVPRTNYELMWDTLVERLGRNGAAETVFKLLLINMPPRLKELLENEENELEITLKDNDPIIVDDFFFLNGNLRKLGYLFFEYLEENNLSVNNIEYDIENDDIEKGFDKKFEVAFSFAGEDRRLVDEVAENLRKMGVKLFYDKFEQLELWGKDLLKHFAEIYQEKAEYCVMFISKYYINKPWPRFERQHALSRAITEEKEYILPIRLDQSKVPGLSPSIGYLDARNLSPIEIAKIIFRKICTAHQKMAGKDVQH